MKILVFSYFYPPAYAVGGKRFANLTSCWVESGWKVGVISAETSAYRKLDSSQDSPGEVYRAPVKPLPYLNSYKGIPRLLHRFWSRYLVYIDKQQGWIGNAVKCGISTAKLFNPQVVVSTGPPFSSFAAGMRTAEHLELPLILDYRDPWTTQESSRFPPPMGPFPGRKLEEKALRQAKAVVGCTERLSEQVRSSFNLSSGKIHTITNGFRRRHTGAAAEKPEFTILYAGSFYGQRSLVPLLEGVLKLRSEAVSVKVKVIGGSITEADRKAFQEKGCVDSLFSAGAVPYSEALDEMKRADVLYLPSGDDVSYALPYKYFDYISTGKPVLAVCPEDSAVSDYITRCSCGGSFTPNKTAEIADFLLNIYSGNTMSPPGNTESFLWSNLALEYGKIIMEVSSSSKGV